jgi:aspartyl-tRNA(Asn)/glutamyl-tRNA(Gln) amidotransferase subunit C
MDITEDTVRQVAKLARLSMTDEEVRAMAPELNDILSYAQQLQKVPLEDVEPTSHSQLLTNALRVDSPKPSLARAEALRNAPDSDEGQIRVPAVLEG